MGSWTWGVFLESTNIQVIMKTICVLLALVAAASAFETCGQMGTGSRIIGGVPAGHGEFPWQISLRFGRYGHICGGTLIGNQWVLCAAHCFGQTKNPSAYTVRVGEWKLKATDGTEKDHRVVEVHVHERYNKGKQFNNDIALMKLAAPVDFNGPYAGPACLPTEGKDYRGSQNCILSGWGLVKRWPQTLADRLQKVTGKIWEPVISSANTTAFPTTLSVSVNPADGLPAWVTPADPSSATTDPALSTSSALSPSDPALAPANPVSSPKSLNTEIGFPRNLVAPSKSGSQTFFSSLFVFLFCFKVNKIS